MIRNTFIHLPGVGSASEKALWAQGIKDWDVFLNKVNEKVLPRYQKLVPMVRESKEALEQNDLGFFKHHLPQREMWRLWAEYGKDALFLDIETTGLSPYYSKVTVIGALAHGKYAVFINGINLREFPYYVRQYPLFVSFNGTQFDVPFLRAHFPHAKLDQPHIDLRFVLASMGYKGGLKLIEKELGLDRDEELDGVDGFEAVRLWHKYNRGNLNALRKLVYYNLTDVANLVDLMDLAFREKCSHSGFPRKPTALPRIKKPNINSQRILKWLLKVLIEKETIFLNA